MATKKRSPLSIVRVTKHAQSRSQQRGIKSRHRDVVFTYADREERVRGGCFRLSLSYGQVRLLVARGVISPQDADRCKHVQVITDGSSVLTTYHRG